MVTSPYEWKILQLDVNLPTNKQQMDPVPKLFFTNQIPDMLSTN